MGRGWTCLGGRGSLSGKHMKWQGTSGTLLRCVVATQSAIQLLCVRAFLSPKHLAVSFGVLLPCSEATAALAGHLRQELAGLLTQVPWLAGQLVTLLDGFACLCD